MDIISLLAFFFVCALKVMKTTANFFFALALLADPERTTGRKEKDIRTKNKNEHSGV